MTTQTQEKPFDPAQIAARAVEDGEDPLHTVIGQLAGYASACWETLEGAGVFQSTEAGVAVDATLEWLEQQRGRTVRVEAGERLVLRLTGEQYDIADHVELVKNIAATDTKVLLVAPEIEAYVVAEGATVEAEAQE